MEKEVYPGRTDLHVGGNQMWSIKPRDVKSTEERPLLDLPPLPTGYIRPEITREMKHHHKLRQLAQNAMGAMEAYWFAQRKLEEVIGECPDAQDIIEDFTNGIYRAKDVDGPTLDRLITLLRQGVDNAHD